MSRSHRDTTRSVSLFPFLAVLMCAMGALIFLLLVTTRRLRQQAIARAEQHRRQQAVTTRPVEPRLPLLQPLPRPNRRSQPAEAVAPPPVVDPNIALKAAVARLSRRRDDLQGNLHRTRQTIAALRQQQDAVEAAVVAARSQLVSIGHQQELERIAARSLLKQQTGLNGRIRRATERLNTIRQTNATAESRFAVLPFDAKTGTTRRPILIECTRDGLRFLPEQVALTRDDLDGFTSGYNPLLAGTRSLIRYWTGVARKPSSLPSDDSDLRKPRPTDGQKPYVLLIVRPGGSVPFYRARKFLARLGEPFGYELLEADRKLALSPVDPGAEAAVRDAVAAALTERDRLVAAIGRGTGVSGRAGRTNGSGTHGGYRAGRGRNGGDRSAFGRRSATGGIAGRRSAGRTPGTDGRRYDSRPRTEFGHGRRSTGRSTPGSGPTGQHPLSRGPAESRSSSRGPRGQNQVGRFQSGRDQSGRSQSGRDQSGRDQSGRDQSGRDQSGRSQGGRDQAGRDQGGRDQSGRSQGGRDQAGRDQSGQLQAGPRSSIRESGTGSGQTAGTHTGGPSGSHRTLGGNTPQPFPNFGKTAGTGSPSARMMRQPRPWGHAGGRAGIGFERNIAVTIDATRIIVGDRLIVPVGQGETRKQLIDQVAAAIDREAKTWGPPPSGFYWVPNIQFEVHPGGNQFYERLNPTFRQWGLSTSVRFPVDSSDAAGNGG